MGWRDVHGEGTDRPPYWRVWRLTHYIRAHAAYLRGRLWSHGTNPFDLDVLALLDVGWMMVVDSVPTGLYGYGNDAQFVTRDTVEARIADDWDEPPIVDEESWGTSETAQRRAAAAVAQAGAAAPMRDPDAPVPESVLAARRRVEERLARRGEHYPTPS